MTVAIRSALPADPDRTFIVASWLDSYRDAKAAGIIPKTRWYDVMWPIVDELVSREPCVTVVAEDDGVLIGFASMELGQLANTRRRGRPLFGPILHYVYVKGPYRRAGIARDMLRALDIDLEAPLDYTCSTPMQILLMRGRLPLAEWEPWIARNMP